MGPENPILYLCFTRCQLSRVFFLSTLRPVSPISLGLDFFFPERPVPRGPLFFRLTYLVSPFSNPRRAFVLCDRPLSCRLPPVSVFGVFLLAFRYKECLSLQTCFPLDGPECFSLLSVCLSPFPTISALYPFHGFSVFTAGSTRPVRPPAFLLGPPTPDCSPYVGQGCFFFFFFLIVCREFVFPPLFCVLPRWGCGCGGSSTFLPRFWKITRHASRQLLVVGSTLSFPFLLLGFDLDFRVQRPFLNPSVS